MTKMIAEVEEQDFGKILAFEGPAKYTNVVLASLAAKLTSISDVIYIDTNTSFTPRAYDAVALERLHMATPYTAEELNGVIRQLPDLLKDTKSKVLILSSFDELFDDTALSDEESMQLVEQIVRELAYYTESRGLITILAFNSSTVRAKQAASRLAPLLAFHAHI